MAMPTMMNPLTDPAALAMGRGLLPGGFQPQWGALNQACQSTSRTLKVILPSGGGNNAVTFLPPGGGLPGFGGRPSGPPGFPGGSLSLTVGIVVIADFCFVYPIGMPGMVF